MEEKTPEVKPVITQAPTMAEQAMAAAEAMKVQVAAMKEQNDIASKRFALEQLGGKSDAGAVPEPVKVETPQDYAKDVVAGKYNVKATVKD